MAGATKYPPFWHFLGSVNDDDDSRKTQAAQMDMSSFSNQQSHHPPRHLKKDIISGPSMIPSSINEKDMDALLAQEMNQLSHAERTQTFEEIHGVARPIIETPELLQERLAQFDLSLRQIPDKAAYLLGESQNPVYMKSSQFRLQFLRGTSFDVPAAAQKCVHFCQGKLELFGPATVSRPLEWDTDLDANDQACLKSGAFQVLPARDASGRCIIVDLHLVMPKCYKEPKNLLKALAYIQLAMAEDEESQKRGTVGISYYLGELGSQFNHPLNQQVAAVAQWFPLKLHALHLCFNQPQLRAWKPLAMYLLGKRTRLRVRVHDGTPCEVQYSLMTFGIPTDCLPITYQGELKLLAHTKWLQRRKCLEEHRRGNTTILHSSSFVIDLPAKYDVLLRRGRHYQNHPGNVRLRQAMEDHVKKSNNNNSTSTTITKDLTTTVSEIIFQLKTTYGSRFLEMSPEGWWIHVDPMETERRVAKSLRTLRNKLQQQQQEEEEQQRREPKQKDYDHGVVAPNTSSQQQHPFKDDDDDDDDDDSDERDAKRLRINEDVTMLLGMSSSTIPNETPSCFLAACFPSNQK